jgi:hypothetical protein
MTWRRISDYAIQKGDCTVCKIVAGAAVFYEAWRGGRCIARNTASGRAKAACA